MTDASGPVDGAGGIREAAAKTTEHVGKILTDLQLEAEGKFETDRKGAPKTLGHVEQKLEDDI